MASLLRVTGATTRILLARHGETQWNRDGRFQGHADPPLNDVGRDQAAELAESLARRSLAALYTSDLRRAAETAELVGRRIGLAVVPHPGLREIDVGSWSGLTREEIIERFPSEWHAWARGEDRGHDGERRDAFGRRVMGALVEIADRYPGQSIAVVAHGGVVRAVQRHVLGEALPVLQNGTIWEVWHTSGGLTAAGQ